MANSIKFNARILLIDDEVEQTDIWIHKLYSADGSSGSSLEESVREELGMLDTEDLRKSFNLEPEKNYEILFSGEVEYFQSNYPDSYGEWDSNLSIDENSEVGLVTHFEGIDDAETSGEEQGSSETNTNEDRDTTKTS